MFKIISRILAFFGFKISRIQSNKVGKSMFKDAFAMQKKLTNGSDSDLIIFDVGAYDGSTALKYRELFPNSYIYSFEPFPESFTKLVENTLGLHLFSAINKGLGDKSGTTSFNSNNFAPTNSLLETHKLGSATWGSGLLETAEVFEIELTTVDEFVAEHKIERIDILKLDVQGAEYLVIDGAKKSLESGLIKMVYTEIITLPTYKGQLNLEEMVKLMRAHGFTLFNFYNQSLTSAGQLRQVDVIFVKSKDL